MVTTTNTLKADTDKAVIAGDKAGIIKAGNKAIAFEAEAKDKAATAVLATYASTGHAIDALVRLSRETTSDAIVAAKEAGEVLDSLELNWGNASTLNLRLRAHKAVTASPEVFKAVSDSLVSTDDDVRPWSAGIVTLIKAAEIEAGIIKGDADIAKAGVSVAAKAVKVAASKAAKAAEAETAKAAKLKAAKADPSTVIAGTITMATLTALNTDELVALISASEAVIVAAKAKADAKAAKAAKAERKAAKAGKATAEPTPEPTPGDDAFAAQVAKLVAALGISEAKATALLS